MSFSEDMMGISMTSSPMATMGGGVVWQEMLPGDNGKMVNELLENAKTAAHTLGVGHDIDPFMTLSFMALPVIPSLRLTTRGVVDVLTQQYV